MTSNVYGGTFITRVYDSTPQNWFQKYLDMQTSILSTKNNKSLQLFSKLLNVKAVRRFVCLEIPCLRGNQRHPDI